MTNTYTLYGSYASYYTAKTRSYLRKKGIPFVERLPSDPLFRSKVRLDSGSHRIPQLLTPDGVVIQDSVEILDQLEVRYPDLPAIPSTPRQRIFVHLMELMASEGLLRLAWLHRWMFKENYSFVKKDFGRSFKPQGSDEDLQKYGDLIADRMMSYGLPETSAAARQALDDIYIQLLQLFELHLVDHPYFLGGHPSAADYAIMGAMHAHMGRDPAGLRVMQDHGPRTFRWVEQMLMPEIQSPEFFSREVEYLDNDEVPQTALNILKFIAEHYGEQFVLGLVAYNQSMQALSPVSGTMLNEEQDQPMLPSEKVVYNNQTYDHKTSLYGVWLSQRSQGYYQTLSEGDRTQVDRMLGKGLLSDLISVPFTTKLVRVDNRLVIA